MTFEISSTLSEKVPYMIVKSLLSSLDGLQGMQLVSRASVSIRGTSVHDQMRINITIVARPPMQPLSPTRSSHLAFAHLWEF